MSLNEKQLDIGKKTYKVSEELKNVASDVIIKESVVQVDKAKIGYILVYPNVSKTVAGRCIRTSKELKFYSDYDYLIEMSGDLWDMLDDDIKYKLTLHELMHIHIDYDKEGEPIYRLRDHDVQDFSYLINKYGIDWLYTLKESVVSVEDKEGKGNIKPSDIKL